MEIAKEMESIKEIESASETNIRTINKIGCDGFGTKEMQGTSRKILDCEVDKRKNIVNSMRSR